MKLNSENPLVSICVTSFNSGRYMHRIIDSSLHQSYKNIEVVIVDDASTDDTEKVVGDYVARDKRVRYFRNAERVFIIKSLLKMLELARGEFVIWPGSDDWLSRDFIATGVKDLLKNPEVAGIVPNIISLREIDNDRFEFINEVGLSSRTYSAEWLLKRMYKGTITSTTLFSLVRKRDMLSAVTYFLKSYCDNQFLPEEFRKFALRAYGIDFMYFLEILTRYKNFISDDSLGFIKITHSENMTFGLEKRNFMSSFLKAGYYDLLYLERIYSDKFPNFFRGMKVYVGTQTLATILIHFLRAGLRPSFLNIKESRKLIADFFSGFSILEIFSVAVFLIPRIIHRYLEFFGRLFNSRRNRKQNRKFKVFTEENFLARDGRFRV